MSALHSGHVMGLALTIMGFFGDATEFCSIFPLAIGKARVEDSDGPPKS